MLGFGNILTGRGWRLRHLTKKAHESSRRPPPATGVADFGEGGGVGGAWQVLEVERDARGLHKYEAVKETQTCLVSTRLKVRTIVVSGKAVWTLRNWARCELIPLSSKTPFTKVNHATTLAGQNGGSFTGLLTRAASTGPAPLLRGSARPPCWNAPV